jgi:gas vesicle protein
MRSFARFMSGFILGGLVGAAAAILLAPYSGEQLRDQIEGEVGRIQIEVKQAATDRRSELEKQLAALRAPKQ